MVTPAVQLQGRPVVPEAFRQDVGRAGEVFGPEPPYLDVPAQVQAAIEQHMSDSGLTAARLPVDNDANLYQQFKVAQKSLPALQNEVKVALYDAHEVHLLPVLPKQVAFSFKRQDALGFLVLKWVDHQSPADGTLADGTLISVSQAGA